MSISDMLPSYKQSREYVIDRIHQLEADRDSAIAHKQWDMVSSLGNRLDALYDTAYYLGRMIREIERHAK